MTMQTWLVLLIAALALGYILKGLRKPACACTNTGCPNCQGSKGCQKCRGSGPPGE